MIHKSAWLILSGLVVMLGPIAAFFIVVSFPQLFSENTILLWHYFSAFGIVLYAPLGLSIFVFGLFWRFRKRPAAAVAINANVPVKQVSSDFKHIE
jgi:hypothetical protein